MKFVVFSLLACFLQGCGISQIHCEIVTDRELIRGVLEEVLDGLSKQDEEAT